MGSQGPIPAQSLVLACGAQFQCSGPSQGHTEPDPWLITPNSAHGPVPCHSSDPWSQKLKHYQSSFQTVLVNGPQGSGGKRYFFSWACCLFKMYKHLCANLEGICCSHAIIHKRTFAQGKWWLLYLNFQVEFEVLGLIYKALNESWLPERPQQLRSVDSHKMTICYFKRKLLLNLFFWEESCLWSSHSPLPKTAWICKASEFATRFIYYNGFVWAK